MKKFALASIIFSIISFQANAGVNTCALPQIMQTETGYQLILDTENNQVSVLSNIKTSEGVLPAGRYQLNQDIENLVSEADCNEGLEFVAITNDNFLEGEYQNSTIELKLYCSADSIGGYTVLETETVRCHKNIKN